LSVTRPFNLLRSFSILSLCCISLISAASAFLLSSFLTKNMLERDAVLTMQFVQSTMESIHPSADVVDGHTRQPQATYADFFAREHDAQVRSAFEDFFKRIALMPEVVRANVYAPDGTIIWSSNASLLGQRFEDNPDLQQALAGTLATKTGTVEQPKKSEHMSFKENLQYFVESYIPIWNNTRERVIGVVEVYKVPTALFQAMARGNRLVWGSTLLGGLFLYSTLFWIVRRATLVIHQQGEQLVASETLATVGEMASAIAHNIRNPLASIRSSAEIACDADEVHHIRQHAEDIMAEVDRLEHWLRELLTYARPLPHTPLPVSLSDVLQQTVQYFDKELARQKVQLLLELAEPLPPIQADASLLPQALHSLIANALDAMPHGGTLTLRGQPLQDWHWVQLQISDTGNGIAKDHIARVFRPFFTTKHKGMGVGLGLAKRIVERHGGTIALSSTVGQGTTVSLRFPTAE
jgi:two-component system, NtrC family, sensor histidine kinase HydH